MKQLLIRQASDFMSVDKWWTYSVKEDKKRHWRYIYIYIEKLFWSERRSIKLIMNYNPIPRG